MPLDFPSIIMAIILMNLLFSVLMIAYSRSIRPRMSEINCVAIAYLLLVIGSILLLFRDMMPEFVGLVLGNFLILEAYIVLRMGIFFFQGRKIRWTFIGGAMVLIPLWFGFFSLVIPDYAARSFFSNGAIVVICLWTVHSLIIDRDPGISPIRKMSIALLASSAALSAARLFSIFALGLGGQSVGEGVLDVATMALQGCLVSAIGLTVILMRTERLNILARQKQAALEESLLEKETLLREIHHRVKNNLQVIISLISLRLGASDDETSRRTLLDIERKVRAMALVHERLYESPSLSRIGMASYLGSLVAAYRDSYDLSETAVEYRIEAADLELPIELAMPIGLIVGELITNSQKHAFPGRIQGEIRIGLSREGSWLRLVVADDGVGLPSGPRNGSGKELGHLLVRSLADQLSGELSVVSRGGLSVIVDRIPCGS